MTMLTRAHGMSQDGKPGGARSAEAGRSRPDACRVLFVESYPQALAGQQDTLTSVLARCPGAGIAPTVAAPAEGVFLDRLRASGIRVVVHPQPATIGTYGGAVYGYSLARKAKMAAEAVRYIGRLMRWIRSESFDALYCNDMRGLLTYGAAARACRVPVLIWDKLDKPHGIYDWFQLPLASRNLVIAERVVKKYPRWQRRLWAGRIDLVRDGLELHRYAAEETGRAALDLPPGAVKLAIVGTISPRKGHDLLLEAFARARSSLPHLHLLVIGAAPAEGEGFRDRLKAAYPDNVHWLGHRDDVPDLLRETDVLVSPSRYEGMGRVNVEAMASGIPVIGARGTGIEEVVVHGETGFLLDPADTGELARHILKLAQDPDLRRAMGEAGRSRAAAEFDADRQLAQVLWHIKEAARS